MTERVEPLEFVLSIIEARPEIREIELSTYEGRPETLLDVRTSKWVARRELRKRFIALRAELSPTREIAFHSRIRVVSRAGGQALRHIPLVDFKTADRCIAETISADLIGEQRALRASLYATGHSYHLYIDALVSASQWVRFMGRVLLLNPRRGPEVVDARWVGHRLMSGFAALRWTANIGPYAAPPRLVRRWGDARDEWISAETPNLLRANDGDAL